jgi:hypothetical protein
VEAKMARVMTTKLGGSSVDFVQLTVLENFTLTEENIPVLKWEGPSGVETSMIGSLCPGAVYLKGSVITVTEREANVLRHEFPEVFQ